MINHIMKIKLTNLLLLAILLLPISCFPIYEANIAKSRLDNIIIAITETKYEMKSLIDANSNDFDKMIYKADWSRKLTEEAKGICADSWQQEKCFERYKDMLNSASEIHLPLAEYLSKRGFRDKAELVYQEFLKKYRNDEYASPEHINKALSELGQL